MPDDRIIVIEPPMCVIVTSTSGQGVVVVRTLPELLDAIKGGIKLSPTGEVTVRLVTVIHGSEMVPGLSKSQDSQAGNRSKDSSDTDSVRVVPLRDRTH